MDKIKHPNVHQIERTGNLSKVRRIGIRQNYYTTCVSPTFPEINRDIDNSGASNSYQVLVHIRQLGRHSTIIHQSLEQ